MSHEKCDAAKCLPPLLPFQQPSCRRASHARVVLHVVADEMGRKIDGAGKPAAQWNASLQPHGRFGERDTSDWLTSWTA